MNTGAPWWYELLWRVALPFALIRLWWRGIREPGYREHIAERLGRYPQRADARPVIWIHAVSVGETRAAGPLITALHERYPDHQLVLTHMTASGRATGKALFGDLVTQAYFPYDTSTGVERFLDWCGPRFGLLLETELWPNTIQRAAARRIPLFLVNARLSERSAHGYQRFPQTSRRMLQALAGVAAQSEADAGRLRGLGAEDVVVTGNVKFEVDVPESAIARGRVLRQLCGESRMLWVAGSTRDGEEALLLDALERAPLPDGALLVIVPRHPQRFEAVAQLIQQRGLRFKRRSEGRPVPPEVSIVLGDSMGEMFAYYAAANIAFVGGSLLPLGGQNLIEPLAVGTPVVIGPSTFNFSEAAGDAIRRGAAIQGTDADAIVRESVALLGDAARRAQMSAAGKEVVAAHRGATARTLDAIANRLTAPTVP